LRVAQADAAVLKSMYCKLQGQHKSTLQHLQQLRSTQAAQQVLPQAKSPYILLAQIGMQYFAVL
jgi:hypothetical protein